MRAARAGSLAAAVWAAAEPLDRRLFRSDYSDLAVLGKAFTRGRRWRAVGLALHLGNGAAFGLALDAAARRTGRDARTLALPAAATEHLASWPLCLAVDRLHPAQGEPGVPPLFASGRAFGQATVRHLLFGALLRRLL